LRGEQKVREMRLPRTATEGQVLDLPEPGIVNAESRGWVERLDKPRRTRKKTQAAKDSD
jgi:hypothetical protein